MKLTDRDWKDYLSAQMLKSNFNIVDNEDRIGIYVYNVFYRSKSMIDKSCVYNQLSHTIHIPFKLLDSDIIIYNDYDLGLISNE